MRGFLEKLAGYFVTGGLAAVVDAGGFALLVRLGLSVPLAATASFTSAAVANYLLSSRFVFGRDPTRRRFALFLAMALLGLLLNVGLTVTFAQVFELPPELAKVLAIGVSFLFNFLLNYFIVFRARGAGAS